MLKGFVYLIQPAVAIGTKRFKIGYSAKSNLSRIKSYGKETIPYIIYECNNPKILEKKLIEEWNGLDYYDGEDIKLNFHLNYNNESYPTIDHKISIFE